MMSSSLRQRLPFGLPTVMLSPLVFFTVAVITEGGVIRQPEFGLNYHTSSSRVVRPALIRSHIAPPIRLGPVLHSHDPAFTSSLLASPAVFHPASTSHATFAPISFGVIGPTHIPPSIIPSSGSIVTSLKSSYTSPSVLIKSAPIRHDVSAPAPIITHISAPKFLTPNSQIVIGSSLPVQTAQNPSVQSYKITHEEIQELPEKSVSYSISEGDYQKLKQHKIEGQDSPYNPVLGQGTASPSEKHENHHTHHDQNKDVPNKPSESDNLLKRNAVKNADNPYEIYSEPSFINAPIPQAPQVIKHIYFHVPPPDFEEPQSIPITLPLPKKTYNILFIKVPAQQQNNAYLKQLLQSRQSQVEDKTLIYVLSKKEDTQSPVVLAPQKVSSPEVFFVKYKTKPGDTTEINNEVIEQSILDNISPVLEQK